MTTRYFSPAMFTFLRALASNNDRDWFRAHQDDYEHLVREPALDFITAVARPLAQVSAHLAVDARKVGGSLFRIQRDTRFSADKTPYKVHNGMQFRHLQGGDVHTVGIYLHLQPGRCYLAAGMWRPAAPVAAAIRQAIAEYPGEWAKAARHPAFSDTFAFEGDSLVRPPRGFGADHPLIEDLKRKDFVGSTRLTQKVVTSEQFMDVFVDRCHRAAPLMGFLCRATGLPF